MEIWIRLIVAIGQKLKLRYRCLATFFAVMRCLLFIFFLRYCGVDSPTMPPSFRVNKIKGPRQNKGLLFVPFFVLRSVFYLFPRGNKPKHKHGVRWKEESRWIVHILLSKGLQFFRHSLNNNHTCSYLGPSNPVYRKLPLTNPGLIQVIQVGGLINGGAYIRMGL